ncbi:MAG TPA: DUF998 domain-containing protein [Gaiellaceae bacterium]|nr:DUF998 domain-containing protein [Gaiellaceae bacterium]
MQGRGAPLRAAGACALAAFFTSAIGWIAGDLAPPAAFSPANDDISDLGALTASSPWLYNQLGANLTGLLVMAAALGLWRALSPDIWARSLTASSGSTARASTPAA